VTLLASGKGYFKLNQGFFPVELKRNDGVSGSFHGTDELVDFTTVQKQFSGSGRIADYVGASLIQRSDVGTDKEYFTPLDGYVSVHDTGSAGSEGFYFPALKADARLKMLFKKVVMAGSFVYGNYR
jgi:hypothetical protein